MLQRLPPVGRRSEKQPQQASKFLAGWYNNNNRNGQWRGGIITIDVIITITGKEYKDKKNNSGEKQGGPAGGETQG